MRASRPSLERVHQMGDHIISFMAWLAAVVFAIAGVVFLFNEYVVVGLVLLVVGFAVGPGLIKR